MNGDEGGDRRRDPLWYKDAIIYEVHVRAFADSDGDGRGDFAGLTGKLDYLRDLGVTAIWLLPFYPSPWRDDGYDIADYTSVHPAYGTLDDFQVFLDEAHRRGLQVITELVINHTSDQHPWFQRARRAPAGSPERDVYVWSDTDTKYAGTRIIFTDTETSNWTRDPVAGAYFWHRFFSHQPDLNFDNPWVHDEVLKAFDFWMEKGVDGMRLDAVPYLYEREGTNNENLPETHAFLKKLRAHVDARFAGRMLLAEANQWPEDSIAYFGDPAVGGDECHMAFHFPVMPRLFMAIRREDRFPIVDILQQTPPIPANAQWATFLRNHDELTLEMVTDEERDYMYRVYAADREQRINVGIRRRLAPLLGNDRRRIELMNALLFSLPGTPVLYYGDEIGMGDNVYLGDRNGVRTPMQWSPDKNAGFSRANPQRLYLPVIVDPGYHYETVNVEAQDANPHSLLWWMRRVIALRKRHRAFSRGTLELLAPDNHRVLAFLRRHQEGDREEIILVVANLSRFVQYAALDLSALAGMTPVELFGRSAFPPITQVPYQLTLSQHSFYWFALEARPARRVRQTARQPQPEVPAPMVETRGLWTGLFTDSGREELENALLTVLPALPRLIDGARELRRVVIREVIPWPDGAQILLLDVDLVDAEPEVYALPVAFAPNPGAGPMLARVESGTPAGSGVLYVPVGDAGFIEAVVAAIERGETGRVAAFAAPDFAALRGAGALFLKLFHRLEPGINPELEVGRFLTERTTFRHVPRLAGWLEIRPRTPGEASTLGVLQERIPHEGDAWRWTLDALGRYFERAQTGWGRGEHGMAPVPAETLLELAAREPTADDFERLGTYLPSIQLLGERTAEMHIALAASREERDFAPEPFSELYQRSLYDSLRTLARSSFRRLRQELDGLPDAERAIAERVLDAEERVIGRFRGLVGEKLAAERIRCHGDYHLGRVLFTGRDFVVLGFEGEPRRPLSERRLKRSPLRDVAMMLRSFHYAASAKLFEEAAAGVVGREALAELASWAGYWERWVSASFLRSYLERARGASFLPASRAEVAVLLDVYRLEKALAELTQELSRRPAWAGIPLQGILGILGE
ncbi:MAG TPA: maltose alpha-D-glucosyltransferase [Thermoanaerobaculia bacterium]|jgi:maltose alpha-D-glucosyltransferase/alpha-amylase|nr:maltose alpha-D-glucosyltransferase [Thermoanaerobaculia bacterium]